MFIYLAMLGLSCGIWDLHCVMWNLLLQLTDSSYDMQAQQLGVWALKHVASPAVATGLVAPWHVRSQFLNQGLNSCPLHCRWSLNHWATREAPDIVVEFYCVLPDVLPDNQSISNRQVLKSQLRQWIYLCLLHFYQFVLHTVCPFIGSFT